ncbi:MAG: enoyl-CoA hydratase/isomerase family protein [Planctomycetaceae bacterium]|nr:enoyl-CoA hydratase/isomerase family protein [Planctomycetaceae bacterium]
MGDLELVAYSTVGDVAVLTINNPPVNALSPGVPEGIRDGVAKAAADDAIQAVVVIGGGRTFIAGADIKEFGKITSGQKPPEIGFNEILNDIEKCEKPVVAAIHGTALGGGLETAMACHYRVAVPDAMVGQPEVKLGIIPGAGGTQRLPRLCGVAKAAEICASGRMVKAKEALDSGIVDKLIEGDLLEGAIAFAREQAATGESPRRTRDIQDRFGNEAEYKMMLQGIRQECARRARGMQAPQRNVDAVELAPQFPFVEGLEKEAEIFKECLFSDESKAMIHVFFGERAVSKVPGIGKETPRLDIQQAAVIGAGTMGGGIAMNYANAGIPVLLKEAEQERLDKGLAIIRKNYESTVAKGKLTEEKMEQRMSLIRPTTTYEGFENADIIVEAVFENMALKKQVFGEIDEIAKDDCILASNTSTLDIDEIAAATNRPASVIGHHFFSPANIMPLIEIVRGKETSDTVIATSMDLAKGLRKTGVLVGNCFGFVGNRMFEQYQRQAQFLIEEGATIEQVDKVMYDWGMAMGPLAVADLAGIDVGIRVHQENLDQIPDGYRTALVGQKLFDMGRYGQKTGAGWYRYEGRTPVSDPEINQLVFDTAKEAGIEQREIDDQEILERCLYSLVNEGAKLLEEGIALRAVDIDIIYIMGYGFPAFRGGPMKAADLIGIPEVFDRICHYNELYGQWWEPAPLLKQLIANNATFAEYDEQLAKVG